MACEEHEDHVAFPKCGIGAYGEWEFVVSYESLSLLKGRSSEGPESCVIRGPTYCRGYLIIAVSCLDKLCHQNRYSP